MRIDNEKLTEKIELIAECIGANTDNMYQNVNGIPGLCSGEFGILLFMYYYTRFSNNKKIQDSTYAYTDKLINNVEEIIGNMDRLNEKFYLPYSNGLSGILYTLKFLNEKEFIEFDFYDYDETVEHLAIAMNNFVKSKNYDFLHGALGIGFYFLKVKEYKLVEELIDNLYDSVIIENSGKILEWYKRFNSAKDFDISLSHGISSIIVFLSRAIKSNICIDKSTQILTGTITYLMSFEQDFQLTGAHFPSNTGTLKSRLAWCYGDLGIASSIWYAGKITNNEEWGNKALDIFTDSAQRLSLIDNHVHDAGICHGSAGIAMIFKRMYIETGNDLFLETAYKWINQTLNFSKYSDGLAGYKTLWMNNELIRDFSLLTGISGIGLVLLSFLENDMQDWDELFLLS